MVLQPRPVEGRRRRLCVRRWYVLRLLAGRFAADQPAWAAYNYEVDKLLPTVAQA